MTEQVAAEAIGAESPASGVESVISSTGAAGPKDAQQKRKKKTRGNQPRDRRPAMKFDNDGPQRPRQRPADQGRKPSDGTQSGRAQAREDLVNFVPRVSVPSDHSSTTVRSETAHRLFVGHFGRAQVSLYNLFEYLPIRLRQVGFDADHALNVVASIEELVNANFKALHVRLDGELTRIRKVASDNAVSKPVNWTKEPIKVSLPQLTPQISVLIAALSKFDEICAYYYGIWLAGESSVRQRETAINNYRNDIAREIRVLMKLYHDSKDYADKRDPTVLTKMLSASNDADLPTALDAEDEQKAQSAVGGAEEQAAAAA